MTGTARRIRPDGGGKAKEVLAKSPPKMSKAQYLKLQDGRLSEELYEGK